MLFLSLQLYYHASKDILPKLESVWWKKSKTLIELFGLHAEEINELFI